MRYFIRLLACLAIFIGAFLANNGVSSPLAKLDSGIIGALTQNEYVVVKGDSLRRLSKKLGVRTRELYKTNRELIDSYNKGKKGERRFWLYPGMRLVYSQKSVTGSANFLSVESVDALRKEVVKNFENRADQTLLPLFSLTNRSSKIVVESADPVTIAKRLDAFKRSVVKKVYAVKITKKKLISWSIRCSAVVLLISIIYLANIWYKGYLERLKKEQRNAKAADRLDPDRKHDASMSFGEYFFACSRVDVECFFLFTRETYYEFSSFSELQKAVFEKVLRNTANRLLFVPPSYMRRSMAKSQLTSKNLRLLAPEEEELLGGDACIY